VLRSILLFGLLFQFTARAQYNVLLSDRDTVKFTDRTGGTAIDSLDLYHAANQTLNPGGVWNHPFGTSGNSYTDVMRSLQTPISPVGLLQRQFAALPHLGFMYSFGSAGTQFVHMDYQQTFRKGSNLAIAYNRNVSTGFMRNSAFSADRFQLMFDHAGRKYTNLVYLHFNQAARALNGGMRTDTLIRDFGLEYTPVFKESAASRIRQFEFGSQHLLNLGNDSLRQHGIAYHNKWSLLNRVYNEQDTIFALYDTIYVDSLVTRDQYQHARIDNALGYFVKTGSMRAEALLNHGYWKFQNLATNRDTNEVEFQLKLLYKQKNWQISNAFRLNLLGAAGEFQENLYVSLRQGRLRHVLRAETGQSLPTPFQRQYLANNHSWKLENLKTQAKTGISYNLQAPQLSDLNVQLGWQQLKNTYFLIGDTWRNDTLKNLNVLSGQVGLTLKWRKLYWQPRVIVTMNPSGFAFAPQYDLRSRIFINKKLFKAQKLNFIIGVDVRYQGTYDLLAYDPTLDLYRLPGPNAAIMQYKSMFKLDFFTGFQIAEFRFYFRFENIDYFWNDQTNRTLTGYPITPNVIRLGLTWDFFN